MTPSRVLTAVEQNRAAEKRRAIYRRKDLYPYSWSVPPPEAERVHERGSIATPSANTVTQILSFQVPCNRFFWFTHILQLYLGGTSTVTTAGDGQIAWDLDVNIPVGVTNSLQGYQLRGFSETLVAGNGDFPYGNFQSGLNSPWQLVKPELIGPENTLRSKVSVNTTVAGNGGRFVTIFDGWLIPDTLALMEEQP